MLLELAGYQATGMQPGHGFADGLARVRVSGIAAGRVLAQAVAVVVLIRFVPAGEIA
jgi:hypothetical protein